MAPKNPDFTKRLEQLQEELGFKTQKSFAEMLEIGVSALGNYFSEKKYGRVPEWHLLLKISKKTGKSINWLLGDDEGPPSICRHHCPFKTCKKETLELCEATKDILESNDTITSAALASNIQSFKISIEREKKIDALTNRVNGLENALKLKNDEPENFQKSSGMDENEGAKSKRKKKAKLP